MADKLDNYTSLLNKVSLSTIQIFPSHWTTAKLTIQFDGTAFRSKIENEDANEHTGNDTETFREDTRELFLGMAEHGDKWVEASCEFTKNEDNKWVTHWIFEYPDYGSSTTGNPAQNNPMVAAATAEELNPPTRHGRAQTA